MRAIRLVEGEEEECLIFKRHGGCVHVKNRTCSNSLQDHVRHGKFYGS